jgi:hypothetical protein
MLLKEVIQHEQHLSIKDSQSSGKDSECRFFVANHNQRSSRVIHCCRVLEILNFNLKKRSIGTDKQENSSLFNEELRPNLLNELYPENVYKQSKDGLW